MTEYTGIKRKWSYSGYELKIVAMACMLVDHIGAVLIENSGLYQNDMWAMADIICRMIGRLAFPLFCFLLVEGFLHTKHMKKYVLRLGALAVVSEVPFDMALFGRLTLYRQNIFFSLMIGLLMLIALDMATKKLNSRGVCLSVQAVTVLLACGAAFFLLTDYSFMGPILIAALYFLRDNRKMQCIAGAVLSIYELTGALAFLLVYRYTGEKGEGRVSRWVFYLFYPLHLLLLFGIRFAVCGY